MRILITMAILGFSGLAYGADALTPQSIADRFFATFLKGGDVSAIDGFLGLNPIFKDRAEQMQQLKAQLASAVQLYGEPLTVEPVLVEDLTPSLQRRVYLTKHPRHPLVWEMYFYKAKSEWIPDQLIFVDQYQVIGPRK